MRCEDEALIGVSPFQNPGPERAAAVANEVRGKARRAGTGAEPGGLLQGLQALAQFLEQ
jgi:hypothetical protein